MKTTETRSNRKPAVEKSACGLFAFGPQPREPWYHDDSDDWEDPDWGDEEDPEEEEID